MAAKLPDSDENLKTREPSWLLPAKIAVVVMGIMIFVGLGVIAYTIATRLAGGGEEEAATQSVAVEAPRGSSAKFGSVEVTIPAGARLGPAQFDDGRMILQMSLPDGRVRLLVIDLATGTELGTLDLSPEKQ